MAVALETADPVDVLTAGTDPVTSSDCLAGSPVTSYSQALLSLVEINQDCALIGWILMLLTPALLCHKDTTQGTQSPILEAFLAFAVSLWYKSGFHAQKGPIIEQSVAIISPCNSRASPEC